MFETAILRFVKLKSMNLQNLQNFFEQQSAKVTDIQKYDHINVHFRHFECDTPNSNSDALTKTLSDFQNSKVTEYRPPITHQGRF